MTRPIRISLRRAVFCVLSLAVISFAIEATAAPQSAIAGAKKPNIIFILADDLGYGDVGCYGQKRIKTPNIDRMAAEGLRFTSAYAGAPVCAPSRCVLMTGLHQGHARVRGNTPAADPGAALLASDVTVARVLKDAGYTTGLIGKWGLGEPTRKQAGLAAEARLRLLLRLSEAGPRAQLLHRLSVAKRIEGEAAERDFQGPRNEG